MGNVYSANASTSASLQKLGTAAPIRPTWFLRDAVRFWAERQPEKTAFIDSEGSVSYARMATMVDVMCSALRNVGVRQGDRIVAVMPSCIEFAVLLFATMNLQVNLVPLDILLAKREIGKRLAITEPKIVFMASDDHAASALDLGYRVVVMKGSCKGCQTYAEFVSNAVHKTLPVRSETSKHEGAYPVLTIFTSGTTGEPKGVLLTEGNLTHAVDSINEAVCCRNDDIFLTALPVSHIYGINSGYLLPMRVGGTSVIMSKFSPSASLDAMEAHRVSVFNGVPSAYRRIAAEQQRHPHDLSSMRTGTIAGAKCTNLEDYQRILHCTTRILYGSTESPIVATTTEGDSLDVNVSGVGRFIESIEPRIVDDEGRQVGTGQQGEIICKSPGTMLGYLNDASATNECVDEQGWIHLGDIGYVDPDGYVHIVGRKNDLINRGGYKVYPAEIEEVYDENPDVVDCCAMGFPHAELGQQIVLFVEPRRKGACPKDLRDYAKTRIAKYKIPDQVILLDKMPHLANGKHDKQAMVRLYETSEDTFHDDAGLRQRLQKEG